MQLKQTGTQWNRDARKDINDNWDTIANNFNGAVQKTIDEAKGQVIDELADTAKLIWVPKVDNYADIDTTYPNPEEGWTVNVSSEGNVYRYDGTDWVQIQSIDPGPYNELTSQLAEKANKNEVNKLATGKADRSYVDGELRKINNELNTDSIKLGNVTIQHNSNLNSLDFVWE